MVMSSTSMDISETFRPEDLSKTDFFDFVTAPEMGIGVDRPPGNDANGNVDQPLQGYDQFWGAEKDSNRLESAIFEDLNRYCWSNQANNISGSSNQITNTDGQIYTLTVLNGTEPWLRKENNENPTAPSLDLDSLLNNFPTYVKSEFHYDDSGFSTEHKEDVINQNVVTNSVVNSTNLTSYQNNNNDWHIADHNNTEQDSPESLLRSALQGKGYSKGLQLQNGITVLPPHSAVKSDEELRRALFSSDQESLTFADSTLSTPLFEENPSCSSPNPPQRSTNGVVVVDDMFLSLEAFSDDFERIKRIASEVQDYCTTSETYPDIIVEQVAINPSSEVTTSNLPSTTITSVASTTTSSTKSTKKYKRANSNNNNNNNSTNNNNNSVTNNNNNSPTQCNGQRKERSLHYCSICSKGFKDKYSVNVHIRTHTGEKPFACSLCGKSFRQKAHLAKHYQTHLAQKNPGGVVKGKSSQQSSQQTVVVGTTNGGATAVVNR